jgi:hypothetical protein
MPDNCKICTLPLTTLETSLGAEIHFDNCRKCTLCGSEGLQVDRLLQCIEKGIPPTHLTCYDQKMEQELKQKPVTITQELLDWHNERRLIFDINNMLTVNANMTMAATNFRNSRWIHQLSHDDLYLVMKRLEAVAAEASIILSETKKRDSIKKDRELKDKQLIKEAGEGRVTEQREKEIKRNRYTPEEKAIKAMMSIGLDRDAAIEELTKQKVKKLMKEHADWTEERARMELEGPTIN